MKSGLAKIQPDRRDYSLLKSAHMFGALVPDPEGLPESFSIYGGQAIPNQNVSDTRFVPALRPLPYGCTGETAAFESGIQDGVLYDPADIYANTRPYAETTGRDMRDMLDTLRRRGPRGADGTFGPKRTAYFNCYGAGKIDDFDAARIALWINQSEKRGVYIGTFWYWGTNPPTTLQTPSFDMNLGTLHCYIATGWITWGGKPYLEVIPWVGEGPGEKGRFYMSREIYNALMAQPYTGAFTITKTSSGTPVPVGYSAVIDHLIYFIRNLFGV